MTKSDLNKKLGGNKQRFSPAVKTATISLVESLSAQLEPGQASATLSLNAEQIATLMALKDQLLAQEEPKDEEPGSHPHDGLVEGGDEAPQQRGEEQQELPLNPYNDFVVEVDPELGMSAADFDKIETSMDQTLGLDEEVNQDQSKRNSFF
ncbi:hypothetical protein DN604_00650 [Aeromonas caviae]|nr:hypothetical protein DN604_00650 [Aeromonas caviae]